MANSRPAIASPVSKTASVAGTKSKPAASADRSVIKTVSGAKPPLRGTDEARADRDVADTDMRPRTAPSARALARADALASVASSTGMPTPTLSSSPSKLPARSSARPSTAPSHKRTEPPVREGSGRRQSKEAMEHGDAIRHASRLKPPTPVNQLLHPGRVAERSPQVLERLITCGCSLYPQHYR